MQLSMLVRVTPQGAGAGYYLLMDNVDASANICGKRAGEGASVCVGASYRHLLKSPRAGASAC